MHRTTAAPRRLRRRLLVVVASAALLVVLLVAAATWYFSGEIRTSALDVTASDPTYDLVVTAVDDDTITLDDSVDPHPFLRDGQWVYGVRWEGGAGQVSGTVEEDGDTVTRQFQVDEGSAPDVGTKVALNRDIVVERPDPPFAQVTYPSGGDLSGWFAAGDSDTWAVLVHGKGGSPAEMARMAVSTTEAGLPSLLIGYRNDPGAPEDPSGHYGYGATEWHDLADAVSYARAHGARHVVLGGASMGGAIVASYLEHADPPPGLVSGVVLDAPMLDLDRVVDHGAEEKGLPGFLTSSAEWLTGVRFGVDWSSVDYLDDTSWASVPVLVLHGTEDDTVQLREFDADHVESFNSDPDRDLRTVGDFLDRVTR